MRILVAVIVLAISSLEVRVLADRNLDALSRKRLAKRRALADAGELLGRIHIEHFAETRRQYRSPSRVDLGAILSRNGADVYERESQAM